jgi:7-cyano-7-deazaguanine synthase in queuosine biosynthesis
MRDPDYICTFSDITEGRVEIIVQAPNLKDPVVEAIVVDDSQLLQRQSSELSSVVADLIDIAIAVHVADRLILTRDKRILYRLLRLPLRNPDFFQRTEIVDLLSKTLDWFTGETWAFEFVSRQKDGRRAELQMRIPEAYRPTEVALWSGGLDALAGLYNRISGQREKHFTLFSSTNGNCYMKKIQKDTYESIKNIHGAVTHKQISLRICQKDQVTKKNFVSRTRGFVFLLFGIITAHLEGQNKLYLYENGIGAINLPFRESAFSSDQSRAVHPISLYYMGDLVSKIFEETFSIINPFLFRTKAQMLQELITDQVEYLIKPTVSCDRRSRLKIITPKYNINSTIGRSFDLPLPQINYTQCGRCSSCLLRRQALLAQGIYIQDYVLPFKRRQEQAIRTPDGDYYRAMTYQVNRMRACLQTADPWDHLTNEYPDLASIARWRAVRENTTRTEVATNLTELYRNYVAEWDISGLQEQLAQGLLTEKELHILTT